MRQILNWLRYQTSRDEIERQAAIEMDLVAAGSPDSREDGKGDETPDHELDTAGER